MSQATATATISISPEADIAAVRACRAELAEYAASVGMYTRMERIEDIVRRHLPWHKPEFGYVLGTVNHRTGHRTGRTGVKVIWQYLGHPSSPKAILANLLEDLEGYALSYIR